MRVRNTTQRNIRLLAPYQYTTDDNGNPAKDAAGHLIRQMSGTPFKVLIPAGATLELDDKDWAKVSKAAVKLEKLGYLTYDKRPDSPLTKAQIIARVKKYESIDLDPKMSKDRLSAKAEKLGVDIWTPEEVVEEVEEVPTEEVPEVSTEVNTKD